MSYFWQNPSRALGKAKRYYVVDQVQAGLWEQVGYFYFKSDAERFRERLTGRTRIIRTYPAAHSEPPEFK